MYLESTQPRTGFLDHQKSLLSSAAHTPRAASNHHAAVSAPNNAHTMERATSDYPQPGLPSPYPAPYTDGRSEGSSATPTSEYGVYPTSARSGSFPEHIQRPYHPHPASNSASSGGMPQGSNSSIAAPSPTYPYSQAHSPYGPLATCQTIHMVAECMLRLERTGPRSQQHKRPRRRYEEIERMYKCGWNGCEKAYGTLNHLNAHVTMQGHGTKRTPDEFKEIRKEWKQRKKEEEAQRKAEEERQRNAASAAQNQGQEPGSVDGGQAPPGYPSSRALQLPPIGYQPNAYPGPRRRECRNNRYQTMATARSANGSQPPSH
ncbi:unnamed protein product [Parascedosporium putredinis]|uniref:C2H2-type domain-containing protein n=1 Tax=Parascedosporium putredinis TaxID=1442378 RepID=A0A9P1HC57_9PEZI|nr:unnamed protein product [Parascedosporium putredinis]CAI8002956.1 unnamed protein product [Parascedosporium putredinis]